MAARRTRTSALSRRYKRGAFEPSRAKVQAILFPRAEWAIEDARLWAAVNGFKTDHFDVTESYVRVHPKGRKKKAVRVKTIPYGIGGIRAVVEWR